MDRARQKCYTIPIMPQASPYRRKLLEGQAVKLYKQGLTVRMVAQAMTAVGMKRSPAWVGKIVQKYKLSTDK